MRPAHAGHEEHTMAVTAKGHAAKKHAAKKHAAKDHAGKDHPGKDHPGKDQASRNQAKSRTADKPASRTGSTAPGRGRPALEPSTREQRAERGKVARIQAPLESMADFQPARTRDPVGLLLEQSLSREPELVPVRHGRMLVSPFTFFRGAALPMAADLAPLPSPDLESQLCGDAHLSNFGAFASPERRLVFDVNDFDETLPGPFEWDVKRLAASIAVAGRENGHSVKARRRAVLAAAASYRTAIREFARWAGLDVWYAHLDIERAILDFQDEVDPKRFKSARAALAKAHTRDSMQELSKLTELVDGRRQIVHDPPTVAPVEEVLSEFDTEAVYKEIGAVMDRYRRSLQTDRRQLLEQFTLTHVARKVVGVGSVGTQAWIVLLDGGDGDEPLFLQAKQAQPSVLARYVRGSRYDNQGERVVAGQRLMQALSDIFLGWTQVQTTERGRRDYYVRQLRDWKYSVPIDQLRPTGMALYGRLCGWTLARAHARSGDRIALAAYLGGSDQFEHAIADFAEAYADQNEKDYAAFKAAVDEGRAEAVLGV
jgi:uncharacterized protein (DUF2252 family)